MDIIAMNIITLKAFLFWCTVVNGLILLFSSMVCVFARDWISSIHFKFFNVSRATVNTMLYSFLALYKVLWITLNLVPWLALLIITC